MFGKSRDATAWIENREIRLVGCILLRIVAIVAHLLESWRRCLLLLHFCLVVVHVAVLSLHCYYVSDRCASAFSGAKVLREL